MKKLLSIFMITTFIFTLCGCQKTLKGTDALIEKAWEEATITKIDGTGISYAGLCSKDDNALVWFIFEIEDQPNYYLPMECKIVGRDEYIYKRIFNAMDIGEDIAYLPWKEESVFIVNNPNCKAMRITDNKVGTHEISLEKDVYPFIYITELFPDEYEFLDENGNVIY